MMNDSAAFRKLLILSWALIEGDDGTEVNPLPGTKLRQVRRGLMCVLSHLSSPACMQLEERVWHNGALLSSTTVGGDGSIVY